MTSTFALWEWVLGIGDKHLRPKSKQKIFDSAVVLFKEKAFYSKSLLVSALNKIASLVEIPSQLGRGV